VPDPTTAEIADGVPGVPGSAAEASGGLTAAEAARRLAAEGPNLLPGGKPRSLAAIALGVLAEPMFLMLLVAGSLYLALGDRAEAGFLLAFVFVVIGMSILQERRTERALASLRELSAPRALVIRDGEPQRIAGREVVRGDLLVLREGDRVAADALLVRGRLSVDESLLTGESVPVDKPGPEGAGAEVFAGTVVTTGDGLATVRAVGTATAVGRIGQSLASTREPASGLQRASRRLVRQLTVVGLALALALVALNRFRGDEPLLDSLLAGVALAMAVLPEEIPVIMTVFLALGAWRIASRHVLTRRIAAVEALGAITVLAVDKTGTLTHNRMAVVELATDEAVLRAQAEGSELPEAFHRLVEFAMLATPVDPWDPMERAIQRFGQQRLAGTEHLHAPADPATSYALSAEIVAMTRVYPQADPSRFLLATKGAPEAVVDLCHLDEDARERVHEQVAAMARRGLRVLGVACGQWSGSSWPASQHDFTYTFLGLVAFADPPREEVPAAIAQCRTAGVRVLMMTGDHPETAAAIARQVGLGDRSAVLTGAQIAELDEPSLRARLTGVDVCARLRPEHKLRLVRALQSAGEVVAMTGDGVNDAPALKAADIGIAMGRRGTDVAREAAALVLLDDRFESLVAALRQGRRIHDNMSRAIRFVCAVHVPIVALALAPPLFGVPVMLMPVHIVLLELLIDPACSVVFEAEPEADDLMSRPPRSPTDSPFEPGNIGRGLAQGAGIAALLLGGLALLQAWGQEAAVVRLAIFVALVLCLVPLVLIDRDRPRVASRGAGAGNPWVPRMLGVVALLLATIAALPWLRELLRFAAPDAAATPQIIIVAGAMVALAAAWLRLLRRLG
jgi:Ca2+-transporting ATPase